MWDFRLVDPDNRTPVDYNQRRALLRELRAGLSPEEILRREDSGLPKLWVTHQALMLRRNHPQWFSPDASYEPLPCAGVKAEHLIAFARAGRVATVVSRWPLRLGDTWAGAAITLPAGKWKNILTGDTVPGGPVRVQPLLRRFPVALLVSGAE